MNKIKIFSLIAVFTALFVVFERLNAQDVSKFKCLKTLEGHSDWVYSVAYSPDGTKIISGSDDETIKIWGEE
jgi:WD40 repeat protein